MVQKKQENGGRRPRKLLLDDNGSMDIGKVLEWVCNSRINYRVENNGPTGQDKLRKVR